LLVANAVVDEETPRVVTRMGGLLVRMCVPQKDEKYSVLLVCW
jgi:hypothetical protein